MNRQPADCLEEPDRRSDKRKQDEDHQSTGNNQHFAIGKFRPNGKYGDPHHSDKESPNCQSQEHRTHSRLENQRLHEEGCFKSLAKDCDKSDADERETFPTRLLLTLRRLAQFAQPRVPSRPVVLVKNPIGNDEQNDDGDDGDHRLQGFAVVGKSL